MIEAAFQSGGGGHPTSTGDALLPSLDEQVCPRCGRETFRTGASRRMVPSDDQRLPREPGVDYKASSVFFAVRQT